MTTSESKGSTELELTFSDGPPKIKPATPLPKGVRGTLIECLMLPRPAAENERWGIRLVKRKNPTPKQRRMTDGWMGLLYLTRSDKEYKDRIADIVKQKGYTFRCQGPVRIDVVVCPHNVRTDSDAWLKGLFDAIVYAGIIKDDNQIDHIEVRRGPPIRGGRLIVRLTEIFPDPFGSYKWIGWSAD